MAKISKICLLCDITFRKPTTETEKKTKFFSILSTRLAKSVKGLNSSLALAAGDLWPKKGRPIAVVKGLNKVHSNICFSKEDEADRQLAYLDVPLTKTETRIESTHYRKNTHTELCNKWESFLPIKYKRV